MSKVSICYKHDYDCIREVEVPDGEHIYPGYTGTFVLYADPGFKERINLDEFVVNGDIHLFIDHTTYFSKLGSSTIYATDEIQPYLGNSIVNNGEDIVVFNGYFPNKPYLISTQHTVHRYDIVGISSSQLRSLSIESLYDYIDTQVIEIKTQNYVMDGKLILRTALNTYEGIDYSDNNVPGFDDFLENIDVFKDEACTISAYPDISTGNFRTNDLVNPDLDTIYCRFKSDCNYTLDDFVTIDFKEREDLGRTVVLLKNKHTTFKDTNLIYHGDWFQDTPGRDFIVPIPKTNDGTVFEGWYYDKELTHKLSVDDPIPDHDTVFYPKFVEDKATVKYWTVTITEAGYPDKTYTVKDGCCLPVEAFISSNPNKFSSGVKETYDDINHPYNITCDCTFTLDGTGVVLEDGYLPTNMRESFNYDGYVVVEYNSSTQEFIPTGIYPVSRSMYIYAFDHNYNIVDEKTDTVGFINIRPMPDKDLPKIECVCGWLGDVVTSQDVLTLISKKILLEPGARFKLYTYNSTYVPGTGWIDEYTPSSLFSSGSEVITPDLDYTWYYYEILPPAASVIFDVNGIETAIEIEKGSIVSAETIPVVNLNGYGFVGWYLDTDYTVQWDMSAEIQTDLTVYAKLTRYETAHVSDFYILPNPAEVSADVKSTLEISPNELSVSVLNDSDLISDAKLILIPEGELIILISAADGPLRNAKLTMEDYNDTI